MKPRDETLGEPGLVAAVEVVAAEVAIIGAVAEHMVGGREHRGGHRQDRFLGAAAAFDAQELSAEVAVFLPSGKTTLPAPMWS